MSDNDNPLKPIIDLAKAREFLALDRDQGNVPPRGLQQREKELQSFDHIIVEALQATPERITDIPRQNDAVSQKAWEHVKELQTAQYAPPTGSAIERLEKIFSQLNALGNASGDGTLGWIDGVEGSIANKENLKEALKDASAATSVFIHRLTTQPQVPKLLKDAERDKDSWTGMRPRNFELMQNLIKESGAVEETTVDALSRAVSETQAARKAVKEGKGTYEQWLAAFKIQLEQVRTKANALAGVLGVTPYEALLSHSENNPGLKAETVDMLFGKLRETLPGLIQTVRREQKKQLPILPLPLISEEVQIKVARNVAKRLGLTEDFAKLDHKAVSTFSGGSYDDVRITARPRKAEEGQDPLAIVMGLVHEMGHAFYNHGRPRGDMQGQPVSATQSLWLHESQSTFWERQIAESKEFMELVVREFNKAGVSGPEWTADNLFRHATRVKPGNNRIDADSVTYIAHILLRHDLEKRLVNGQLEPEQLEEEWNKGLHKLLPDAPLPKTPMEGVLQDSHWSNGSFGYFPSYALGMLGAAQMMETIKSEMPDVGRQIREGKFENIHKWLETNIHQRGSVVDGEQLILEATGKKLSADAWLKDVRLRFVNEEPFLGAPRRDIARH